MPAFAANDPLGVVNNMSDFVFSIIKALGVPKKVIKPVVRWDASWDLRLMPICTMPKPSRTRWADDCFCKEILDLIMG